MTERSRSGSYASTATSKMAVSDDYLGTKKTVLVLVIVVGCFAVLWPKVFYPMMVGSAQKHIKPSPIDRTTGCCDVISEIDVNTIKLMSELCRTIIAKEQESAPPFIGREIISRCRKTVLDTCGIDIAAVLQEQVRLGQTTKQILDEIRSMNGSLCLKYNFGVAPWRLGVPHRVAVRVSPSFNIRQERPPHLRSEMVHPAFRERGRAIPQTAQSSPSRPPPKILDGRPGPIPGMRPTIGGAGHVVPPPKQSNSTMGLIMPIYTMGIVIFFTYTVMKIIFKKQPEALYPPIDPDPVFRREVFEANRGRMGGAKPARDGTSNKLVVNAMSALLDEVDQELAARRKASEGTEQDVVANGNLRNQEDQASVKVLGMEMRASCEGGQKWARPDSPVVPTPQPHVPEPSEPPHEIYLEGSLPPQSNHLLVADSATEAQKTNSEEEDPAVVLAGKMTLSVISLDSSENGADQSVHSGKKNDERSSSDVSEDFEKIELDEQIGNVIREVPGDLKTETPGPGDNSKTHDVLQAALEAVRDNTDSIFSQDLLKEIDDDLKKIGSDIMDDLPVVEPAIDESPNDTLINEIPTSDHKPCEESTIVDVVEKSNSIIADDAVIHTADEILLYTPEESSKINLQFAEEILLDKVKEANTNENSTNVHTVEEVLLASPKEAEEVHIDEANAVLIKEPAEFVNPKEAVQVVEEETKPNSDDPASDVHIVQELLLVDAKTAVEIPIKDSDSDPENSDVHIAQEISVGEAKEAKETDLDEGDNTIEIAEASMISKLKESISDLSKELDLAKDDAKLGQNAKSEDKTSVLEGSDASEIDLEQNVPKQDDAEIQDLDLDEDEEEVEYEYEEETDDEADEEIRNMDRIEGALNDEQVGRANGAGHGMTSNATMAEQDISDEENYLNEDDDGSIDGEEDIQELIEYLSDDEEEEDLEPNDVNHINNTNE